MIPLLARIRIRHGRSRLSIWAPLFLLWLLLLPFAILLAPMAAVMLAVRRIPPFRAMAAMASVVGGLAGTEVCVRTPMSDVLIRLI